MPLWDERLSDWFTAINPKQAVPVVRDGALLLHESNTIVTYIATKYGPQQFTSTTKVAYPDGTVQETTTSSGGPGDANGGLLPVGPEATAVAAMWTEYTETTIAPKQNLIFFPKVRLGPIGCQPTPPGATPEKRPGCPTDEATDAALPGLVSAWAFFEKSLGGKLYVAGEQFTTGDICPAIQANRLLKNDGFGYPELAPANFPNLVAWFERVSSRPKFAEICAGKFK